MSTTYTVAVMSPCDGNQSISQVNDKLYTGMVGDFTMVVLALDTTSGRWLLTVYDYSDPSGPCYPFAQFGQVTANPSDPTGGYGKMVNGSPDTGAGAATVL